MMTKVMILQCIEELESTLATLRVAVEQWSEAIETPHGSALDSFVQAENSEEPTDLQELFAMLRTAWNIPPEAPPDTPLTELQKAMAEGLPENWASREVMRMREE